MTGPERKLRPPATKKITSAARVADDWYVVSTSKALKSKPVATHLLGIPIVVFRAEDGTPGVLLDRCPHRNVPLSFGRVDGPHLECGYHGWRFTPAGQCAGVPGLCGKQDHSKRGVPAFATREQDGLVWAYATPDVEPRNDPYSFPLTQDDRYMTVIDVLDTPGTLHAVAEVTLDVPHTAFLHRGWFRGVSEPNEIEVHVQRFHDRIQAQYIGEPAPTGFVGRVLAPGGGQVTHFDRFIMPCIAQVEYQLGERSHIVVSSALTPINDSQTRLYAVASFRLPLLPHWLIALALRPVARKIFSQDEAVLGLQTQTIDQFGGEQFMSTELDVMGQGMRRLLRDAERGHRQAPGEVVERRFKMRA